MNYTIFFPLYNLGLGVAISRPLAISEDHSRVYHQAKWGLTCSLGTLRPTHPGSSDPGTRRSGPCYLSFPTGQKRSSVKRSANDSTNI